ncbi:MAG: hypothetical protein ABIG60_03930 [Patescibacteria group bacterium]
MLNKELNTEVKKLGNGVKAVESIFIILYKGREPDRNPFISRFKNTVVLLSGDWYDLGGAEQKLLEGYWVSLYMAPKGKCWVATPLVGLSLPMLAHTLAVKESRLTTWEKELEEKKEELEEKEKTLIKKEFDLTGARKMLEKETTELNKRAEKMKKKEENSNRVLNLPMKCSIFR